MPVLRELVSRFSFSVDKKSVASYERTISGMKRSAVRLGGALGIAFSGKALFNMGVSATQAKQNIDNLAGTNLTFLNNEFEKMKSRIDDVRSGASDIVTTKTKDILAASFVKTFSNSKKELKDFITLLESASIKSITTGEKIETIFGGLMTAVETGDLGALAGFGKIGLAQRKISQARISAQDPQEFGGLARPAIARKETLRLLKQTLSTQQERLRSADLALMKTEEFKKTVTEGVNEATSGLLKFAAGFFKPTDTKNEELPVVKSQKATAKQQPSVIIEQQNITIKESDNPRATVREFEQKFNDKINEANTQRIQGEDRSQ